MCVHGLGGRRSRDDLRRFEGEVRLIYSRRGPYTHSAWMQLAFRVGERHYRAPTNAITEVVQFFKFSQHMYDNNFCYICIKVQKYINMSFSNPMQLPKTWVAGTAVRPQCLQLLNENSVIQWVAFCAHCLGCRNSTLEGFLFSTHVAKVRLKVVQRRCEPRGKSTWVLLC